MLILKESLELILILLKDLYNLQTCSPIHLDIEYGLRQSEGIFGANGIEF